jgi:hypothetical protein
MAIASSAVPAAITQVDARTESEFTTPGTIPIDSPIASLKKRLDANQGLRP